MKKTVEKVKKEKNGKCQNESIDPANDDGDKQRSQPSKVAATLAGATTITSHQCTVLRRSLTALGMHQSFSTPLSPAKSLTSPSQQHLCQLQVFLWNIILLVTAAVARNLILFHLSDS